MATFYGSWVAGDDFRTILEATVTNAATTSTVKLVVKCESRYAYAGSSGRASCTCNGTTRNANHGITEGATTTMMTETFTVARGTSAKKITVKGKTWIVNTGIGSYGTGSTASGTVTIPALASYKVTYNANGGAGAPAAQTKWYGKALTLSSAKPTRAGYSFQGWATSASGAVAYKPGASYTGNAALTLYAVWKRDYIAPSITGAAAYRVASNTSTAESPTGGYAYAEFAWKVDTTLTSGNAAESVAVTYRAAGASAWSAATVGGTTTGSSGTVTGRFAAAEGTAYEVKVTVTDTSGQAGSTVELVRSIGVAAIPLQIRNRGRGVGILAAAPDEGLRLGGEGLYVGDGSYTMADLKALLDNVGYVNAPKVLWSHAAGYYMNENQTCSLSELMSEQARGIVLHWQGYIPGEGVKNYQHNFVFIPKTFNGGYGVGMVLMADSRLVTKYVYVADDHVTGNVNNSAQDTISGVSIDNRYQALTEILGV